MKMKKVLAFIAAVSMLSVTGVNAFAEEAVVTDEVVATEDMEEDAEVVETEIEATEESAAVEGVIEEDVITTAVDADFTIGDESFYTEVDSFYVVIYKITDKGSAIEVGRVELDSLVSNVDHYEVYGNQLVIVCYVNNRVATVDCYYDSVTGEFRYVNDTDNVEYNARKQAFELNGVSFIAELSNGQSSENGGALNLSVYFEDGTATNLQDVQVIKDYIAGDMQGSAVVHNVNNYFTVSRDNLIVYNEDGMTGSRISKSYTFDKSTNSFVESSTIPDDGDKEEVTEEMLYNKFISEYDGVLRVEQGLDELKYTEINGERVLFIKIHDVNEVTTYYITKDDVVLINRVPNGCMASAVSYKTFTCDGFQFMGEVVSTHSDGGTHSYITIYKCENDGTLTSTNIYSKLVHDYIYTDIGGGIFDYVGDKNWNIDDLLSVVDNTISLKYTINANNIYKTVTYEYDESTNSFVEPGQTPDEKTFTVEIPYTYFTVISGKTGQPITKPGVNKSMVNAEVTSCSNGNVKSINEGCEVSTSKFAQSITVENVKPGKLIIKGNCTSYTSLTEEEINAGYITFENYAANGVNPTFEVTVTIDENGKIVTGSTDGSTGDDNSDTSGDSTGSTTGGTANSPSTADTMAIPAVAGSAAIVLSAVIYVSKRKR